MQTRQCWVHSYIAPVRHPIRMYMRYVDKVYMVVRFTKDEAKALQGSQLVK